MTSDGRRSNVIPLAPRIERVKAARKAADEVSRQAARRACVNLGIDPAVLDYELIWEEDANGKIIPGTTGSAIISECGLFRYHLQRDLGRDGPTVAIFGVNPATADAERNDQTIRKDIGFGERLGWGQLIKGNKFAFRAADVRALRSAADPVGPKNDAYLEQIMRDADLHIVAWGPLAKLPPHLRTRWRAVVRIAKRVGCPLFCFGTALDGHPRHTVMLSYATALEPWSAP